MTHRFAKAHASTFSRQIIFAAFLALSLAFVHMIASPSPAFSGDTLAKGTFTGASGHVTSGSVTVEKSGSKVTVVLGSDFEFDGAPDPKFAFAKNGSLDTGTIFSALKANSGRQVYDLPASIDASDYDQLVLWCEKYSVPLGSAKLN